MIDMINAREVRNQLEALANEFENSDKKAANRLLNLRSAVSGGNNADAWASTDIKEMINPDQIIEHYKNQRVADNLIQVFEWIRNILIFTPLLVSWFGISQAVTKYTSFVTTHQDQITQPFLYLWQTGFGGTLPGFETLGFLAGVDAFLLLLLIILTIVISSLSDLWKQRLFVKAEDLRADLADTLASAALCLTTRHWQQPTDFVSRFDESSKFFKEGLEKLVSRIEALALSQKQDHDTFSQLRTTIDTMAAGVRELKVSNEALRVSMSQVATPLVQASNYLGTTVGTLQSLITSSKDQLNGLKALGTKLDNWGASFQSSLTKLDESVQKDVDLLTGLDTFTRNESALIGELKRQLQAQESINANLNGIYRNMVDVEDKQRKVIDEFFKVAVEFRAFNKEVYELKGRLAQIGIK